MDSNLEIGGGVAMLKVLNSMDENRSIRQVMKERGHSFMRAANPRLAMLMRWFGRPPISIGELNKSWDVYEAAQLIAGRLKPQEAVLDMGAFGSEILLILDAMGFNNLKGIDLNPDVARMPRSKKIEFSQRDFYKTGYPAASFKAITSISAIEHGCDVRKLLEEVSRLLAPGGIFVGSTDYWPEKIQTDDVQMFGLDWKIFSASELEEFFRVGQELGLRPLGICDFSAKPEKPPIHCAGKDYSFALFAMEKAK
jgi:SAM-dependent methyltransferase